ncbi:MAG TPA: hypothetical protein VD833_00660 [Vicinamibacterales bacterium]|nr:hypothetical protein [Vicinamibacterales bacterium]
MKRNVVLAAALGLAAAIPVPAQAQMLSWQDRAFVNFSAVIQSGPGDSPVNGSFELYEETGTFQGPWDLGGGAALDLSGGYRVWRNLAVGLSYSRFGDSAPVTLTALVPDPLTHDQPQERTVDAGELDHTQSAVHLSATWVWPMTDKIDVALSGGPSFFRVRADTVTGIDVEPNTSNPTGVVLSSESESAVGAHIGVDVTYRVWPRGAVQPREPWIGGGILLRYAGASADLSSIDSLDLGGVQLGFGVRVRF